MENPLVSVCICTRNSEEFIKETLESVISQSYTNMEILICDNGSLDKTCEIINSFTDPRIKLYKLSKNIWSFCWLNYLMDRASWKYIAIQDHDDLWKKQKIEMQVYFMENNPKYIGCWTCTCMWFQGDNKCFYYDWARVCSWVIHPSLMFRNCGRRYDTKKGYMCDCYFMKKILCGWQKLMYNIPDCLTIHRIRIWLKNYSYSWFKFTRSNIKTVFYCHNPFYAICMIGFELCRKIFYPFMSLKARYKFERFPFILKWYKIQNYVKC